MPDNLFSNDQSTNQSALRSPGTALEYIFDPEGLTNRITKAMQLQQQQQHLQIQKMAALPHLADAYQKFTDLADDQTDPTRKQAIEQLRDTQFKDFIGKQFGTGPQADTIAQMIQNPTKRQQLTLNYPFISKEYTTSQITKMLPEQRQKEDQRIGNRIILNNIDELKKAGIELPTDPTEFRSFINDLTKMAHGVSRGVGYLNEEDYGTLVPGLLGPKARMAVEETKAKAKLGTPTMLGEANELFPGTKVASIGDLSPKQQEILGIYTGQGEPMVKTAMKSILAGYREANISIESISTKKLIDDAVKQAQARHLEAQRAGAAALREIPPAEKRLGRIDAPFIVDENGKNIPLNKIIGKQLSEVPEAAAVLTATELASLKAAQRVVRIGEELKVLAPSILKQYEGTSIGKILEVQGNQIYLTQGAQRAGDPAVAKFQTLLNGFLISEPQALNVPGGRLSTTLIDRVAKGAPTFGSTVESLIAAVDTTINTDIAPAWDARGINIRRKITSGGNVQRSTSKSGKPMISDDGGKTWRYE